MKFIFLLLFVLDLKAGLRISKKDTEECSKYVNLQRQGWYIQRNIPTLDQGPVGLCYAHAAVSLLDLWRDIHGIKITRNIALSNPQYAAFLYKKEYALVERSTLDMGDGYKTLMAIKKNGMCRYDVIENIMNQFSQEHKISTRDWYAVTEWFLEFYNLSIMKEINNAENKAEKLKEIFSRYQDRDDVERIYKYGDFKAIYEGLKPYLLKKDYRGYVQNVFYECTKKENIYLDTLHLPKINFDVNRLNFMGSINSNLDQKNPIGISYSHKILKGGGSKFDKLVFFLQAPDHESVLIGKRVREGKCQFLLKNTWGNYCKYSWECQKSPQGLEVGAWIDAEFLLAAIKSIYFFDMSK